MDDKILIAADSIARVFNETTEWLDPKRAAVVKILKELVEGVQTQATNSSSPKLPSYADIFCAIGVPKTVDERKGGIKMYEYLARHFGH